MDSAKLCRVRALAGDASTPSNSGRISSLICESAGLVSLSTYRSPNLSVTVGLKSVGNADSTARKHSMKSAWFWYAVVSSARKSRASENRHCPAISDSRHIVQDLVSLDTAGAILNSNPCSGSSRTTGNLAASDSKIGVMASRWSNFGCTGKRSCARTRTNGGWAMGTSAGISSAKGLSIIEDTVSHKCEEHCEIEPEMRCELTFDRSQDTVYNTSRHLSRWDNSDLEGQFRKAVSSGKTRIGQISCVQRRIALAGPSKIASISFQRMTHPIAIAPAATAARVLACHPC